MKIRKNPERRILPMILVFYPSVCRELTPEICSSILFILITNNEVFLYLGSVHPSVRMRQLGPFRKFRHVRIDLSN